MQGDAACRIGTAQPLVLPETFSGEGDFIQWHGHFESVAAVNGWSDAEKLLWFPVHLTGHAQTAYTRLADERRGSYVDVAGALRERFEPSSKKELHIVNFKQEVSCRENDGPTLETC